MSDHHLATYLNDHLAGSVAGLELLAHLETVQAGTPRERILAELKAEIQADQQDLKGLMNRLHVTMSLPRKATAWLAEKMTQLKLRLDDPARGDLHLLEVLEALSIGIEGKRLLWCALATAAGNAADLRALDYERLQQRAEEQRRRVETMRLEAARSALGAVSPERKG